MFNGNACGLAGIVVLFLLITGLLAVARRNHRSAMIRLGIAAILLLGGVFVLLDWDRTMRDLDRRHRLHPATTATTQGDRE